MSLDRERKEGIILLSGGIDSVATYLWLQVKCGWDLWPVYVDFGLPDSKAEIRVVKEFAGERIPIVKVDLPFHEPGSYIDKRTDIILSIAASYGQSIGTTNVIICILRTDTASDLQYTYITKLGKSLGITVVLPFAGFSKVEVLKLMKICGYEKEMTRTWSCWTNSDVHCGSCDGDGERRQAFKNANIGDPTVYKNK